VIHRAIAALRRAATLATRRPRTALWTLLALSCALFVAGIAAIAAATVDRWAEAHPGSAGTMVVYLGDGVDPARAGALVGELRALHGVERAELVPAAESASRLVRALGSDPALLEGVDVASLPASVEVTLAPGVRDVVAMSPTVRALRGAPGVAEVVVEPGSSAGGDGGGDGDRIAGALHTARGVAWAAAALFAGLALVIALAAVRVRLDRSPREAAVLQLLGAPPSFVAIPSALAGALQGAVAAVVAALAIGVVLHGSGGLGGATGAPGADAADGVIGALSAIELASPPAAAIAALIAIGALVGLVGGGLAGVARAR
jgi:cell division protein FtsX